MEILFNQTPLVVPPHCTIALFLELQGITSRFIAVAVDEEVVPRNLWSQRKLTPGARVAVIGATQGG